MRRFTTRKVMWLAAAAAVTILVLLTGAFVLRGNGTPAAHTKTAIPAGTPFDDGASGSSQPGTTPSGSNGPSGNSAAGTGKTKPVFIIYYMWWDRQHWVSHLGPNYPVGQSPNPLPATLDSSGCGTANRYSGNVLTDVRSNLAYDQDNYQTFLDDVKAAAATGANGFIVNWVGDGTPSQSAATVAYNRRLDYMFQAVHAVNAGGRPFKLMFNYQSSAKTLTMTQFTNDLNYLVEHYGTDPVLDHTYSAKPEIVMAGTWKYRDSDIQTISQNFRSKLYLIGDEKPASWNAARATYLDGTSYYWSSQDPYNNPSSFGQLRDFARTVRAGKNPDGHAKTWLAPFTPGYNAMLLYNTRTCVPRNNGDTMHKLFAGNLGSDPDGWTLISWNEISEGSYIVPLTRYGNTYTDTLRDIIRQGR